MSFSPFTPPFGGRGDQRRASARDPGWIAVGRQQVPADDAIGDAPVIPGSSETPAGRPGDSLDSTQCDLDSAARQAGSRIPEGDRGGEEPDRQQPRPGSEQIAP